MRRLRRLRCVQMLKLWVLVVAVAALAVAEENIPFNRELGPLSVRLQAGDVSTKDAYVQPSARSVIITNRIIQFVENYRQDIEHGNDVHPPLDPYHADELGPYIFGTGNNVNLIFRMTVQLNNFNVHGLNSFVVENLVFSLLRMNLNFKLNIPAIEIQTDYNTRARLALLVNHRATGVARLLATDIQIDGHMQLVIVNGYLQASVLQLNLDIGRTSLRFTELTGIGVIDLILNYILQNVSASAIQDQAALVSTTVSEQLFDTVNEVLGQYTLEDLIGNRL